MAFELFCGVMLALAFAAFVAFAGYRFFLILLPFWGFFWGWSLGTQTVQALLKNTGTGADVIGWVVGFFVGLLFAVLSYLFYLAAVALFSASIGYGIGVAIMGAIMPSFGFLTWLVGIVLAVVLAFVVLRYNIQKYVIIIGTALFGAGLSVAVISVGVGGLQVFQNFTQNPLQVIMGLQGFWGWLVFLGVAIGGAFVQWRSTATYTIEAYENRM